MKTEYNYEDQSLLLAIKNGNEKAFDTLFRKYYPMLCAYGNKFVELEDAEECVQDAMLWLWENKDMLVIQSSLSNYLFSIVTSSCYKPYQTARSKKPGRKLFL